MKLGSWSSSWFSLQSWSLLFFSSPTCLCRPSDQQWKVAVENDCKTTSKMPETWVNIEAELPWIIFCLNWLYFKLASLWGLKLSSVRFYSKTSPPHPLQKKKKKELYSWGVVFALATSDLLDYGDCLFLDTIERAFDICRTVCHLPNDKGHYVWEKDSEISSFEYLQTLSLHFKKYGGFFLP